MIILGAERRGVISARTRIILLIDGAKKKMPFTHFISFPLNARSVQEAFADFKSDVLRLVTPSLLIWYAHILMFASLLRRLIGTVAHVTRSVDQ